MKSYPAHHHLGREWEKWTGNSVRKRKQSAFLELRVTRKRCEWRTLKAVGNVRKRVLPTN